MREYNRKLCNNWIEVVIPVFFYMSTSTHIMLVKNCLCCLLSNPQIIFISSSLLLPINLIYLVPEEFANKTDGLNSSCHV